MKSYSCFGIYDFSDFAEELVEEDLLSVNGGANYGQCGGEIKFIPPTGPTGPTYNPTNQDNDSKTTNNTQTRNYGDCGGFVPITDEDRSANGYPKPPTPDAPGTVIAGCGGNYVILDNGQRAMFMEQKTFSAHYHDEFGNNACAATSLLNELSELYTKETGKVLTPTELSAAMAKAVNSGKIITFPDGDKAFGDISSKNANVNSWNEAANDMAKSLGLTGKFTYTTDSSNADIIIYAVDNTKKDKNGNKIPGTDGIVDHFVNDIGNGKYYDPYKGTVGNVSDLTLATEGNGSKRCLKYSN